AATGGEEPAADLAPEPVPQVRAPPAGEQLVLEEPRETDVVGEVLELGRIALAGRGVLGEPRQIVRQRVVSHAELAQERAVNDEVRIAPDRRGEVAVRGARKPRVA